VPAAPFRPSKWVGNQPLTPSGTVVSGSQLRSETPEPP
jgi:hypothetical protein